MSKVMLIEDDPTMRTLLGTLLEIEGFQVVKAGEESSASIFALMRQQLPDLVLLDVNLRFMNGLDLLRQIRADPQLNKTCVLMSSGMDFTSDCQNAGADGFLLKPYMPADLLDLIRRTLDSRS